MSDTLAGLLWFSSNSALNHWEIYREMSRTRDLMPLILDLNSVSDLLQIERGLTTAYMSGKDGAVRARLLSQRLKLDREIKRITPYLERVLSSNIDNETANKLSKAHIRLADINLLRRNVDSERVSLDEMFAFYSNTINGIFDILIAVGEHSSDASITRTLKTYATFIHYKEHAGQERALGAAGFIAGAFDARTYTRFAGLISTQEILFEFFEHTADNETMTVFKNTMEGEVLENVDQMRRVVISRGPGGSLNGITGMEWFDLATKRIELLQNVSRYLNNRLYTMSEGLSRAAYSEFMITLTALFTVLIATIYILVLLMREIKDRIKTENIIREKEE
ncbi:MAG: nitrate- and nitrite sensing domain-containing protein, partial [Thermodesulfobacteriota bacterium]